MAIHSTVPCPGTRFSLLIGESPDTGTPRFPAGGSTNRVVDRTSPPVRHIEDRVPANRGSAVTVRRREAAGDTIQGA
jgi:hypothetical protein